MTDREMKAAALLAKWIERSAVIGWFSKAVVEVVMEPAFDILTKAGDYWALPTCDKLPISHEHLTSDRDAAVEAWSKWEAK